MGEQPYVLVYRSPSLEKDVCKVDYFCNGILPSLDLWLRECYKSWPGRVLVQQVFHGTSGNYMLSELKEKIFNPLVTRVAQKVFPNMEKLKELHWMLLGLVLWNSLLTVIIFYKTLKSFQCRRQNL